VLDGCLSRNTRLWPINAGMFFRYADEEGDQCLQVMGNQNNCGYPRVHRGCRGNIQRKMFVLLGVRLHFPPESEVDRIPGFWN